MFTTEVTQDIFLNRTNSFKHFSIFSITINNYDVLYYIKNGKLTTYKRKVDKSLLNFYFFQHPYTQQICSLTLNELTALHLLRTKFEVKSMNRENSLPWHSNPIRAMSNASLDRLIITPIISKMKL